MKLYIVTARCGNTMESPLVFKSEKEAWKNATDYVLDAARDTYSYDTGGSPKARRSTIERWANENGYDFSETYFWDGTWDAVESDVTEVEV